MNNYTKITVQDIEIASQFFENEKHLDEFLANVCRYYSGKNLTIKTKIVRKYFETYKKTMDGVIKARDYGKNGGTKRVENQEITNDTLKGSIQDTPQPKLKEVKRNKEKEKEVNINIENEVNEIYEIYPSKCPFRNSSTGKSAKNKKQIEKLIKDNSFENIKQRLKQYIQDCINSTTFLKNFGTILNQLPEASEFEAITETPVNDETIVVYTNQDDIDPEREHRAFKRVFDEYLTRNKPVKFIRYAGI